MVWIKDPDATIEFKLGAPIPVPIIILGGIGASILIPWILSLIFTKVNK